MFVRPRTFVVPGGSTMPRLSLGELCIKQIASYAVNLVEAVHV